MWTSRTSWSFLFVAAVVVCGAGGCIFLGSGGEETPDGGEWVAEDSGHADTTVSSDTDGMSGGGGTAFDLEASSGAASEYVELHWNSVSGAEEYRIFRDGRQIAAVSETTYRDREAEPGGVAGAPTLSLEPRGDDGGEILTWTEPAVEAGGEHVYRVVVGENEHASSTVTGYRAGPPITAYEVEVSEGTWQEVGAQTQWEDAPAQLGRIQIDGVSASQGEYDDYVQLEVEQVGVDYDAPYRVRAVTGEGAGEPSAPVEEAVADAGLDFQWERSEGEHGENFVAISGGNGRSYRDEDAPSDGTPRYYRVEVDAPGAEPAVSDGVEGWTSSGGDTPIAGAGEAIWRHDFSSGMPEAFQHDASYPDSGTWGREHEFDGKGTYEPASVTNRHLVLTGPHCSHIGVAYPTEPAVDRDLTEWELHYRVDARPGEGHKHVGRMTGGIGCAGCEPTEEYSGDWEALKRGSAGFFSGTVKVAGEYFAINGGFDANGDVVEEVKASTGGVAIAEDEWHVRIATSESRAKTWVKYWKSTDGEPEDWTHEFDVYIPGRPSLYVQGHCKPGASGPRKNLYAFYELREIAF